MVQTVVVHPGAADRPPPGAAPCVEDVAGDGWMHVPLLTAAERDGLSRASRRAGWWSWYQVVSYVAWWPSARIFVVEWGIPNADGALVATFAQFHEERTDQFLRHLRRFRG